MKGRTAMLRLALLVSLVLLGMLVRSARVRAQDASPESEVRTLLERGVEEYSAGRWDEARAIFEQAHRLKPTARTARGIGMAAFNQRDYVGALTFLELALSSKEQPLTEVQAEQSQALLRQALGFVGRFRFSVSQPEARLEVRGVPTVPGEECVLPIGSHLVRAHAPGFLPIERTLEVRGGEATQVTLTLVPVPVPEAAVAAAPLRSRLAPWGWSVLGGAGAIAGAALVVTLRSDAEFDELRQRCRDERCFPGEVDTTKVERLDHGATALWITSAAAAAAATALLSTAWLRARKQERERVQLRATGLGLLLDVRY
jgi:hypothetical protein